MIRFLTAAALLALCAPVFTSPAAAQQAGPSADPRTNARMRFGIFYLTPTLSIERVGIDTNVFPGTGEPKSDFTATMTPATTVWVPVAKRALLTTQLGLGFVYYKTFKNLRSVNPAVSARGELYARRLTFFVDAGTSSTNTQPNLEIDARVKHGTETLVGGIQLQMQRGLSFELSSYRNTTKFDDDAAFLGVNLKTTLDRAEEGIRVRVRERLTSLTTVGVIVETRNDRFERSPDRDAEGYRAAATIDLAAKALISGSAEIGFRHQKSNNPLVPAFRGLVAKVAVANKLGDSLQTSFGWDRDTNYSFETVQSYVSNAFSVNVQRQLAGRFDANVGAVRNRATYRTVADAALTGGGRDLTMTYTVGVGSRLGRDVRLGLAVSRTNRTSTRADARQYSATQAGLSFNYGF